MPRSPIIQYVFVAIHEARSGERWAQITAEESDNPEFKTLLRQSAFAELRFPADEVFVAHGPRVGNIRLV